MTYSYSSSAGSVSGTSSSATLSTSGVSGGTTITVTCNVVDDMQHSATAMTSVSINNPPPPIKPPAPTAKNLCSVAFDRDKARPTRVDNEGKGLPRRPRAGYAAAERRHPGSLRQRVCCREESEARQQAAEGDGGEVRRRARCHAKSYLVTEKGIDASRIKVYTGATTPTP